MAEEQKQEVDKVAEKKRKQHEAWKRWYHSPKGADYRLRKKLKRNLEPQ